MKNETITRTDISDGVVYEFESNKRYSVFVPMAHVGTAESRITEYYARRSNTLQLSDIAEFIRKQ